jgi:hypothetical protein
MRSLKTIGLMLVAILAFSAVAAASASAEEFEITTKAKNGVVEATSGETVLLDKGNSLICKESSVKADVKEGALVKGEEAGEILAATWNKGAETCESEFGNFSVLALVPWKVLVDALVNNDDLALGLFHIKAHLKGVCSFLVEGLVPFLFHNSSQRFLLNAAVTALAEKDTNMGNSLTVSNTSGLCLGEIVNGDKPVFDGEYVVAAGQELKVNLKK